MIALLLLMTFSLYAAEHTSSEEDEISFLSLSPRDEKYVKPVTTINYNRVAIIAPHVSLENIKPEEDLLVVRDPRQGYVILDGADTEPIQFISDSLKKMSPYEFSLYVAYNAVILRRDSDGVYHLSEK